MSSPPAAKSFATLPEWVPENASLYVMHAHQGRSLRAVAATRGCAASTVLRQVRAVEQRRDDPLFDEGLDRIARSSPLQTYPDANRKEPAAMSVSPAAGSLVDDTTLRREAKRVLRRLCEPDSFLVVGQGMPQAVVLRGCETSPTRTAVLPRAVAQAMVLKDWIACFKHGRVARYRITETGRAALRRMLGETLKRRIEARGTAEAPSPFLTQHMSLEEQAVPMPGGGVDVLRVNLAESPLGSLARKKGADGAPFLTMDVVAAGERLRGDFERAQMGPRVGQNWERFLTAGDRGAASGRDPVGGPEDARARVSDALRALGPGLGDVVLRVCCFLEGLEAAEKRLGWSARSGKVVLRIALQRLRDHYAGGRRG